MKKYNLVPLTIFFIVAVIYSFYILRNISYWGQMDWDQFTFWNAVPRETILKYHQFPLWNPYVSGGNVLLAHPHTPFLSPFYIFILTLGPILGLKIQIIVHMVIGLYGMFFLARYLGLDQKAAYLASFIFMMNSLYPLHLTEGHTEWLAMVFIPWFYLYYLKGLKQTSYLLGPIIFLTLILLNGSVDVFNVFNVFMGSAVIFQCFQQKSILPLRNLILIFLGTFLLCAVKIFPMLEFLNQFPRLTNDLSGMDLWVLIKSLFGREQAYWDKLPKSVIKEMGIAHGWHEYGAYVGILSFLLFLWGVMKKGSQYWPMALSGCICLLIALGGDSPFSLWNILHRFPIYNSLTVPSRFILGFIFIVSIFAAWGLMQFDNFIRTRNFTTNFLSRWSSLVVVLFILNDLWQVNSPIFKNAFRVKPIEIEKEQLFHQKYKQKYFCDPEICRSSIYPIFLSNAGILNAYEVVMVNRGDVRVQSDPDYRGEVYLARSGRPVSLEYFSPNRILVSVEVASPDILVVNQNYYTGWKLKENGRKVRVSSYNGLISVPINPGHHKFVFYYLPFSFVLGLGISLTTVLMMAVFYRNNIRGLVTFNGFIKSSNP